MGSMLPSPPAMQIAMPQATPTPPLFGMKAQGADLRKTAQADRAKAFGGSLMGSQLTAANTGGKSLLGQTG